MKAMMEVEIVSEFLKRVRFTCCTIVPVTGSQADECVRLSCNQKHCTGNFQCKDYYVCAVT